MLTCNTVTSHGRGCKKKKGKRESRYSSGQPEKVIRGLALSRGKTRRLSEMHRARCTGRRRLAGRHHSLHKTKGGANTISREFRTYVSCIFQACRVLGERDHIGIRQRPTAVLYDVYDARAIFLLLFTRVRVYAMDARTDRMLPS